MFNGKKPISILYQPTNKYFIVGLISYFEFHNNHIMARKIIGYAVAVSFFLCSVYLDNYNGNLISHAGLWEIVSICVGLLAAYLAITSKSGKVAKKEADNKEKINRLRQIGNKIIVSLDDCEIKESNYYEDADTHITSAGYFPVSFNSNENYEKKEVDQSVIVYWYKQGISNYKIISQVFSHDAVSLSVFVENKQVVLYVNPDNKDDYLFELDS